MKKLLYIILVAGCLALSQNAAATPYQVNVGDYIYLQHYNSQVMAGEMVFDIKDQNRTTYSSWSTFCVEMNATTYVHHDYQITALVNGINGVATNEWNQISWLYYNFAQGTLQDSNGIAYNSGNQTQQSALQSAFWMLTGSISASSYAETAFFLDAAAAAVANGWQNNGRVMVAVNAGQNVLVSIAPVPEPATLLLLGAGLICLAALGRRKISITGIWMRKLLNRPS